jgi:predicted membrane-bound spermidine synthase
MFKTGLSNPYLELQSTSTGNKYRLYINFGKLQERKNNNFTNAFYRYCNSLIFNKFLNSNQMNG